MRLLTQNASALVTVTFPPQINSAAKHQKQGSSPDFGLRLLFYSSDVAKKQTD